MIVTKKPFASSGDVPKNEKPNNFCDKKNIIEINDKKNINTPVKKIKFSGLTEKFNIPSRARRKKFIYRVFGFT